MANVTARRATEGTYRLGEGALWDDRAELVRWVDIPAGLLLSGRLQPDGRIDEVDRLELGGDVTAVVLTDSGSLIVGLDDAIARVGSDGTVARGPSLLTAGRRQRMNDACADAAGRVVIGSVALDDVWGAEVLLQADSDGAIRTMRAGVVASNGIAFAPDDSRIYHVDTGRRTISAAHYDVSTGSADDWTTVVALDNGYPDGLTVDRAGYLWVAMWGLGEVRRYNSAGRIAAVIDVPAPQTSSVTFAGDELATLVISTARDGLSEDELTRFPDSGALFVAEVGAVGFAAPRARSEKYG